MLFGSEKEQPRKFFKMASEKDKKSGITDSKESKDVKFPEFPDLKPDEISGMSHDEKLKLLEKEAQTLYDFCLEKGLSKKDISWCLKPLFGSPPEFVKKAVKDNAKFFTILGFLFGLLAIVFGWSPAYNFVCVHGKLALMKALPYWDWTYLYDQDCLVKNPYVAPQPNITKEECQSCFEIAKNGLDGLRNVSHDVIANDFLLADFPAVIEDGTKGWPKPDLDLDSLSWDYNNHADLDSVGGCRFNSSIDGMETVYDFFNAYKSKTLPDNYYAIWENCDLRAAKHFRLNYRRPYYLPPMAEAAKMNTFFIAKGKLDDPIPFSGEDDSSGIWITVVSGKLLVDVIPVESCANFKGCHSVSNVLNKGEAMIVPLRLWQIDVSSDFDGETIAIGSTASWDESEGPALEDGEEVDRKPLNDKDMKKDQNDKQAEDGNIDEGPDDNGPNKEKGSNTVDGGPDEGGSDDDGPDDDGPIEEGTDKESDAKIPESSNEAKTSS